MRKAKDSVKGDASRARPKCGPQQAGSPVRTKGQLDDLLTKFDVVRHGGEAMPWSPVGFEFSVAQGEVWRTEDGVAMGIHSLSPEPGFARIRALLGDALLAELLEVSTRSLQRYAKRERMPKGDVLLRFRWLAGVADALSGAYNEDGARQWFRRPRAQLDGLCPKDFLGARWLPDSAAAMRVYRLTTSLTGVASRPDSSARGQATNSDTPN